MQDYCIFYLTMIICTAYYTYKFCLTAGDDEQSDFYCEPDYPCAGGLMAASMIAGARSCWKMDHYQHFPSDAHLARLQHDVCNHMSPSLRNSYKTRCKILARITSTALCRLN